MHARCMCVDIYTTPGVFSECVERYDFVVQRMCASLALHLVRDTASFGGGCYALVTSRRHQRNEVRYVRSVVPGIQEQGGKAGWTPGMIRYKQASPENQDPSALTLSA